MDLLCRFPDKATAESLGLPLGFATQDPETGVITPILATHEFALAVIGEHLLPTGALLDTPFGQRPEMAGDGFYWVLFRPLIPFGIHPLIAPHVVWNSDDKDELGKPVPRPAGAEYPQNRWA